MNTKFLLLVITITLAMVFTLAFLPTAGAEPENLIYNGDFSLGNAGWYWPPLSGTESCCAGGYPPGAYPEAYAHPDGSGGYIVPWQDIPNPQAGDYTLRGWIRTVGGDPFVWIQADNGDFYSRYCQTPATSTQSWQEFSCTFHLSAPATIHVALVTENSPPHAWGWAVLDHISLERTGGGPTTYDLAQYIGRIDGTNGPVYQFTSGEIMQVQYATNVWQGKPGFYQVKQLQGIGRWEEMSYGNTNIRRLRDTSDPVTWYGLYAGCPYACLLGAKWVPRNMYVGQTFLRTDNQVKIYNKSNCALQADYHEESCIKLEEVRSTFWINGYNLRDVAKLTAYHNLDCSDPWEDYYYAKGIGLVLWHDHDHGTTYYYNGPYYGNAPTRQSICNPSSPSPDSNQTVNETVCNSSNESPNDDIWGFTGSPLPISK